MDPQQRYAKRISEMTVENRLQNLEGFAGYRPMPHGLLRSTYYNNMKFVVNHDDFKEDVKDSFRRWGNIIEIQGRKIDDLEQKLRRLAERDRMSVNKELFLKDGGIHGLVGDDPANIIRAFASQRKKSRKRRPKRK